MSGAGNKRMNFDLYDLYREGKIEAFKMMQRYLFVITESCDLVTSRDFNTINAMRGFIENNLRRLEGIE